MAYLLFSILGVTLLHASRGFLLANDTIVTEVQAGYGACPANCKITPCANQVGCSLCENGFCLHYQKNGTSSLGVCLSSCPSGFYCQQIRFSICRACKDAHCDTCNSFGKCTACQTGFSLVAADGTCHAAATTASLATAPTTSESTTTAAMTSSPDMTSTMGQTSTKAAMNTTESMTTLKVLSGAGPVVG